MATKIRARAGPAPVAGVRAGGLLLAVGRAADRAGRQPEATTSWTSSCGAADFVDLGVFSREDGIKQFRGQGAEVKNALFNWGLGAIAWLVVGRILDRIVKP